MAKKIVVIDDEEAIVDGLQGMLSDYGYEVITACDGDDGLLKIKSEKPDLIILDALIPGITGCQIVDELRLQPEQIRSIPLIMMSGRKSMRDVTAETFAFIDKPFDADDLMRTVKRALGEV